MAKLGDWRNSAALEIPLDGVGGVSLLVRADLHRKGVLSPRPLRSGSQSPLTAKLSRHRLPHQTRRPPDRN